MHKGMDIQMATVTIYSTSSDGYIISEDNAAPGLYADAREGTGTTTFTAYSSSGIYVGQGYATGSYGAVIYTCYEGFISFDTSSIVSTHLITATTLSLYAITDYSSTDFITEARIHDWGGSLTTADYVAGSSLSGKTKVATRDSNGLTGSAYNSFTSEAGFTSNLNTSGTTYILLCSKEQTDNSAPTTNEFINWADYEYNSSYQPKLVLTYTDPVIKTIAGVPKIGIKKVQQLA